MGVVQYSKQAYFGRLNGLHRKVIMNKWLAALLAAGLGFSLVANATIDETIRVKQSIEINAPADKVWATVGNFGDASWLPGIAKTELTEGKADEVGAKRVLTLQDGGNVHETLTSFDAESRIMKFEITESVLPLREFGATIKVEAAGDKTVVRHSARCLNAKTQPILVLKVKMMRQRKLL